MDSSKLNRMPRREAYRELLQVMSPRQAMGILVIVWETTATYRRWRGMNVGWVGDKKGRIK